MLSPTFVIDITTPQTSFEQQSILDYLSGEQYKYHNYTEITDILERLNATYPVIMDVFPIGRSWQDRAIFCAKLTNENISESKPKILFVGYHHARERISAELPLHFVVYAAENYGIIETVTRMLDQTEIYVIVALNVDGFNIVDANEWQRKNARPVDEDYDGLFDEDPPNDEDGDGFIEDLVELNGSDPFFIQWEGQDEDSDNLLNEDWVGGVDLNRNYGYQWNAVVDSGSRDPNAEDYRGSAPFSEPETQALRDFVLQHTFEYAVSFHSGIELILYPWGFTSEPPADVGKFVQVSEELSTLVNCSYNQSGASYTLSGSWGDWMFGHKNTLAFTCEVYGNLDSWQYEPTAVQNISWEKGVFQYFNPEPQEIEQTIQRWMPIFFYIADKATGEGSHSPIDLSGLIWIILIVAAVIISAVAALVRRKREEL